MYVSARMMTIQKILMHPYTRTYEAALITTLIPTAAVIIGQIYQYA